MCVLHVYAFGPQPSAAALAALDLLGNHVWELIGARMSADGEADALAKAANNKQNAADKTTWAAQLQAGRAKLRAAGPCPSAPLPRPASGPRPDNRARTVAEYQVFDPTSEAFDLGSCFALAFTVTCNKLL